MTKKIKGVSTAQKKDSSRYYRASITYRNKHISLGSHSSNIKAGLAYEQAKKLLFHSDISVEDYVPASPLPFEKWVVLINFRDHGLYIPTPVYLKNKFFLYYLSPSFCLKFDIDDLFYYSSHKIMKRGRHLFVADYGMQYNILNRYGIMSYAVASKDYFFINGDDTDFRYENIKIVNRYRGVSQITGKKGSLYKVTLHIRSNYVVGTYETEAAAAIAYNKAVDIVKRNGIDRKFTQNYVEGLSPAAYADLYTTLPVSEKIRQLGKDNH